MSTGPAPSPLARYLFAAYALLVTYASLHPFSGWRDPGVGAFAFLTAPLPRYFTAFDLTANVMAYVPLGMLAVLALYPAARGAMAVFAALALTVMLSAVLEALQTFLPSRIPSNLDLISNTLGGLAGALTGHFAARMLTRERGLHALRHRLFQSGRLFDLGLVLLALWLVSQLNPETLLFGTGDLRDMFQAPDGRHYPADVFIRFEAAVAAANVIALGLFTVMLARRGQAAATLLLFLLLIAFLTRTAAFAMLFSPQDALLWITPGALFGVAVGTLVVVIALRLPPPLRLALCGLSLMAATAVVNFAPANPYLMASLSVWRQGHFLNFNGLTRLVSAVWPFLALAYLIVIAADRGHRNPPGGG